MSLRHWFRERYMTSPLVYNLRLVWEYHDFFRTRIPFVYRRFLRDNIASSRRAAAKLKGKEVVEVAFFLSIPGMWKADYLFRRMQQDLRFHPYVVIIPYTVFKGFDKEEMWRTLRRTEHFVQERGFEYVIPYDAQHRRWRDIRRKENPDVVFYSLPYKDMERKYYVYHFRDRLTCYIPYAFTSMNVYKANYDIISINSYGCVFTETSMHLEFARRYSHSHGDNFEVVGCPGCEVYQLPDYKPQEVWKPQPSPTKRVIWAPHHSISDVFSISTFLENCDLMVRLAKEYEDRIQFAFKPHPTLKFKLQKLWGVERTEAYYRQWELMPNTQLEEAGYVDLFYGSDAMMHDSGGFTTEYLYMQKPVMYLVKDDRPRGQFNAFGALAFDQHYMGRCEEDVRHFLDEVVLSGNDPMSEGRRRFYETYLASPDGLLPSQRIINVLLRLMDGEG
ncbi:MAG: CDP-glycerol glycerophosphotransferase family protein [Bacteroidales bacterium]|nr:CDP-glycerol glycerophosphotransferase family protein [Bacteroidales bacterium]